MMARRRLPAAVLALIAAVGIALLWREQRPAPTAIPVPTTGAEALRPPTVSLAPGAAVEVPALAFSDAEGRALSLADFRGRVILLNVWATWCTPCRRELPALDRLQARLGGPDFEVLVLSVDRQGVAAARPFFEQLGLKALHLYADPSGRAMQSLKLVGLPTTLLIDRAGRQRALIVGPAAWDSAEAVEAIRRLLSG
jgi:thiol-disulfide isomerase/thioredoxin